MTGLFDRVKAIVSAKINKLLDKYEDPREQLDYAYDKLNQQLHNVDMALARAIAARKKLEFTRNRLQERIKDLEESAKRAIQLGREDLARKALERKIVLERELESINKRIEEMKSEEEGLKDAREKLRSQVELFRAKKEQLKAEYEVSKAQVEVKEMISGLGDSVASVSEMIERAEKKIDDLKARSAALDEVVAVGGDLDLLQDEEKSEIERELDKISLPQQVEEELAKLKQTVKG